MGLGRAGRQLSYFWVLAGVRQAAGGAVRPARGWSVSGTRVPPGPAILSTVGRRGRHPSVSGVAGPVPRAGAPREDDAQPSAGPGWADGRAGPPGPRLRATG